MCVWSVYKFEVVVHTIEVIRIQKGSLALFMNFVGSPYHVLYATM